MRSDGDIQDRIRYLLSQELDKRVRESFARLPVNCVHNYRHGLDVRKSVEGEPNPEYNRVNKKSLPVIGLCMYGSENPQEWEGRICEDPIDAQRCSVFTLKATEEALEKELSAQLKDLLWVQDNMPEVYGLLWALGSESAPKLPWWKRLWFKLLQVRPDPLALPYKL